MLEVKLTGCPFATGVDCCGADLHGECQTNYKNCGIYQIKNEAYKIK